MRIEKVRLSIEMDTGLEDPHGPIYKEVEVYAYIWVLHRHKIEIYVM